MSILFINGSPNRHGNTASLAATLLKGKNYETLNLTDYTIGAYGSSFPATGWIRSSPPWKRRTPS